MERVLSRLPTSLAKSGGVMLFAVVMTAGLMAIWPHLQTALGTKIPDAVYAITRELARVGLFVGITTMIIGNVPNMNRFRIGLYLFCTACFLINLLGDDNLGNVFLEAALMMQMAWSLYGNWRRHEPMTYNGRRWAEWLIVAAIGYGVGLLAVTLWPVDSISEYGGWFWPAIAMIGGISLFAEVNLLETGILRGDGPRYIALHGFGCLCLTASYLGQYNEAGLTLNMALFCVVIYSYLKARRKQRHTSQGDIFVTA